MSINDILCDDIILPFIKQIIEIRTNLKIGKININDNEVKKLKYIIKLFNNLVLNKKTNNIDDFIISEDDNNLEFDNKYNENDIKIYDDKVLNMIKKSKIIFKFYEKNEIIRKKTENELNETESESETESENDK
jgi:hypothetical protein